MELAGSFDDIRKGEGLVFRQLSQLEEQRVGLQLSTTTEADTSKTALRQHDANDEYETQRTVASH
jgi:hypothetical protein